MAEPIKFVDDDREAGRFRVNRVAMVDEGVFAQERDRIFNQVWLYIGHESELRKPNDFKTRNVAGRPLIFARDKNGQIQVWINSCPHRGATICREREGNARFMTCFYHGWSFNTSGQVVSIPVDSSYGADFSRPGLASPPKVDSYRGFVFVSFNPAVEPLVDYLADAADFLDLVCDQSEVGMEVLDGTHEYSVKANWKLLVENSYDGYHAVSTHQRYFEMIVASGVTFDVVKLGDTIGLDLGNGHGVVIGGAETGGLLGRPLSDDAKAEKAQRFDRLRTKHGTAWIDRLTGTRNLVIFPNLVVIDLVMGVVIRKIDPIRPDYMEVTAWEFAPPEEGPELKRQRLDNFLTFWGPGGLASPDDVEALESCQKAFASHRELAWSDISRGMANPVAFGHDELQMRTWWRRWDYLVNGVSHEPEPHDPPEERFVGKRLQMEETVG